ncbi:hypothetical protein BH09SUM1_BH09SUM1_20470 [soil metagenome]
MTDSPAANRLKLLAIIAWFYTSLMCLMLHFSNVYLVDYDSYFHVRYSSLLPGRIFSRTFPTTEYSVWGTTWGDKEFLLHLFLMPFVKVESFIVEGAKLAGATLNMMFLASLAFAMKRQKIRAAAFWPAVMFAISGHWLIRFGSVRGQLLSLVYLPWIILFFQQRRAKPLAVVTFLFTWSYTASYFAFVLVLFLALGRWLIGIAGRDAGGKAEDGACDCKLIAWCFAATLTGMLIHPNTPNLQLTNWIHIRHVLAGAWGLQSEGIGLGGEFNSGLLRESLTDCTGMYIALGAAWLISAAGRYRVQPRTLLLLWMTMPLFGLFALSYRFVEYIAPMSLWALAAVLSDQWDGWRTENPHRKPVAGLIAATAVVLIVCQIQAIRVASRVILDKTWSLNQQGSGKWLRENAAPGTLVIPLAWGQFPQLFFHAPALHYPVGLDPMLMHVIHPDESRLLDDMLFRRRPYSLEDIHAAFPTARYFVVCNSQSNAFRYLDNLPYVPVYQDADNRVYDLQPPAGPPAP